MGLIFYFTESSSDEEGKMNSINVSIFKDLQNLSEKFDYRSYDYSHYWMKNNDRIKQQEMEYAAQSENYHGFFARQKYQRGLRKIQQSYRSENGNDRECYEILKKYGIDSEILCKKVQRGALTERRVNAFGIILAAADQRYSYPSSELTYSPFHAENYMNSVAIQDIINAQEPEVAGYLRNLSDDTLSMPNHIREKYLEAVREMRKTLQQVPYGSRYFRRLERKKLIVRYGIEKTNYRAKKTKIIEKQLHVRLPGLYKDLTGPAFQELKNLYDAYKAANENFNSDIKGTRLGQAGEETVLKEFDFYRNQMKVLTNIRLEVNGQSVESDLIVVSPYGLFIIEVKNLGSSGSYSIAIDRDGRWKKVMRNGKFKPMGSVSSQNVRHLHGVETVVNEAFGNTSGSWIQAHSIIAFANDTVNIQNNSNNVVLRSSEIINEIRRHPIIFSEDEIEKIADIIQKSNKPALGYDVENWVKKIIMANFEINEKSRQFASYAKPFFEIANFYASTIFGATKDALATMEYDPARD